MRVLHVVTALNVGGAEMMLLRLLQSRATADTHGVVSLIDVGPIGLRIAALGIQPMALGMRRTPNPFKVIALARMVSAFDPDVVQTWMYHADLVGGISARLAGRARVVWGIHNSTLDPATTHRTTRLIVTASAPLSRVVPDAIVCVSRAAQELHGARGYDPRKFVVIPNGFDVHEFRPDDDARHAFRVELGLRDDDVLIGMIARINPQKDHGTFIGAAISLARRHPTARFLLCGGPGGAGELGATPDNRALTDPIEAAGLRDRFFLVGRRDDVPRILPALDLATLSSAYGEAFPLVLGEAMACGVPCVATDVGDSAFLIGDTGRIVPPRDPEALAGAWAEMISLGADGRRRLGMEARARIDRHFKIEEVSRQYQDVWHAVLERRPIRSRGSLAE